MASDEPMDGYFAGVDVLLHDDVRRLSRLSIETTYDGDGDGDGDDADVELSDDEGSSSKSNKPPNRRFFNDADDDDNLPLGVSSLPGTPDRLLARRPAWAANDRDYASDAEAKERRSRRRGRERWLDKAWEMRRSREASEGPPEGVLVRPAGGGGGGREWSMRMDSDEVRACRDLGIGLPCDCTVEIPYAFSGDTSSGGNSPVASWRISSPGDDPKDVKARLKTWAQAVALASASRHSG